MPYVRKPRHQPHMSSEWCKNGISWTGMILEQSRDTRIKLFELFCSIFLCLHCKVAGGILFPGIPLVRLVLVIALSQGLIDGFPRNLSHECILQSQNFQLSFWITSPPAQFLSLKAFIFHWKKHKDTVSDWSTGDKPTSASSIYVPQSCICF